MCVCVCVCVCLCVHIYIYIHRPWQQDERMNKTIYIQREKRLSTKKRIHRPWQRDLQMQGGVSSLAERRTADASDPRTLVPVLGFRVYGLRW